MVYIEYVVRLTRITVKALAALNLVALVACGAPAGAHPGGPPLTITQAAEIPGPDRHELWCIDVTTSVSDDFRRRVLDFAAATVTSAVTGPGPAAIFYFRKTVANSYAADAELTTVRISAVPPPPARPVLSTNPFDKAKNARAEQAYEEQHRAWNADVEAIRATARAEADRIRNLTPPTDGTGTDVLGCPLLAPRLLGTEGARHLFVGSDLVASGPQQDIGFAAGSLAGVRVTIVPDCRDLAGVCEGRLADFVARLRDAGTTDVTVRDPQTL